MTNNATRTAISSGRILPENTVLSDRYRILRLLGVGAMGMVYLAHDEQLDIDVALKILRTEGAAGDLRLERFRSELVLARQISHRNVVRIHDIGQSGEMYYITMDYVDGRSLKQILELEGALPPERATGIAIDLAEALVEAHRTGVVHRDIKPANVMIAEDRAYLTDFGIARSLHSDGMTKTGEIVGTLDYLSPEQARGQPVDGRADLYALGLLLFEMVTGKLPFSGETADEVLAQRTLAQPKEFLAKNSQVPPALQRIIARCLAVDPDERYQSAEELANDLRSGTVTRRWLPPRKKWLQPLVATVAIVAVGGGLWLAWMTWQEGTGGAAAAAEPLAVLPFEVAVGEGDLGSISHGLAELLSEQLAASTEVRVVSTQRVAATLRDLKLAADRLGESDQLLLGDLLDADYLVEGRLQKIDDNYRVEVRLRRASSRDLVHRAAVDTRNTAGIYAAIVPLANELLANLDAAGSRDAPVMPDADPDALNAFATGVDRLSQGNALGAVDPLQQATTAMPGFVLAWDRLAQALAAVGRDREALRAAEAAVDALGETGGRTAALVRARRAALAGEPGDAAAELEGLLGAYPGDNDVRFALAEIYGDTGRLQDAEEALLRVVEASPDHPQAWYLLGKFAILRGAAQRAADDYLVKALVIQNRLNNAQGRADALNALGIAKAQLGETEEASDFYGRALAIRQEIGDDRGVAAVLANMARIDLQEGRYEDARESLVSAKERLNEIGDRWTVANLENELGFLEEQRGRFEAALDHYRESLRIRRDLGDRRALAESYNNVGYAYYLLGEYDNAAVFNSQSVETYREIGNREGIMFATQIKGILDIARGHYDDALKALLESLQISRDLGNGQAEALAEAYIGRARHLQGRFAAARASLDIALEKLEAQGDLRGLAEFELRNAELSLDLGMLEAAAASIERAKKLLDRDDNPARRALQHRLEGAYADASGDSEQAATHFREALREAEASGEQVAVLQARLAIAARPEISGTDPRGRVEELLSILDSARRLGHGQLEYEAGVALARAYLAAERYEDAERVLADALQTDHVGSGFHADYRLHVLLADTYEVQGRDAEEASAWDRAGAAVERALSAQNDEQKQAFAGLPAVRRVLEREGREDEQQP